MAELKLTLPCVINRRDSTEFEWDPGDRSLMIDTYPNGAEKMYNYLDEEGARQLFNWLGVWLHKP